MNVTTIVLINGLWMTALSWDNWVKHYSEKGYWVIAANWPGMDSDIGQLRRDPSSFANLGLTDVVDHYEQIIRELENPPIIIGYGLGGLVTQILLDRGWGAAGVGLGTRWAHDGQPAGTAEPASGCSGVPAQRTRKGCD